MSLWENSLVEAYQGKGKRKVDHQRTSVVTNAIRTVNHIRKGVIVPSGSDWLSKNARCRE